MGLKEALKERFRKAREKHLMERKIRAEQERKYYGKMYAQAYKKQMQKDVDEKFRKEKTGGFAGRLKSDFRSAMKKGFLQPDQQAINNALHGNYISGSFGATGQSPKAAKKKKKKKESKTIIIKV